MQSRLQLIAPNLADHLTTASPATQAAMARTAVLAVTTRLDLDRDESLGAALTAVRTGQPCPELNNVHTRVDQLDTAAFDAGDHLDAGTGDEAAYEQAFQRARAATAVAELCGGFAADAVYEALQAADATLFHQLADPAWYNRPHQEQESDHEQ